MTNINKKEPLIRFDGFTDDWEQCKSKDLFTPLVEKGRAELPVVSVTQEKGVVYRKDVGIDIKYDLTTLSNYKVIKPDNFVISLRSFQGGFELSDKLGITSPAYTIFTPKNSVEHNNNFWKVQFKTFKFIESLKTVTFGIRDGKSISFSEFGDLKLIYPCNEEQTKIGNFFKQLDESIALHERELVLLKEQKKSLLQKMFPKKGSKVPEMRFAEFTDDWEQHELGDYIIQFNEVTTENNQHPVFTSSRRGLFFQKDYYEGNQIASENNIGYNIVPRGYFTYRHMSDDLVFKFNINNLADYGIVSTLYPVFTTTEKMDSNYLQYHLNEGEEFRRFSILQKQGGSRTYMYLSKLKCLNLIVPIIEEQRMISSFFKQLDDTITLQERKLETLKNMKKSFLQKMFV